jgi:anhydro-N-acetylmuramic acid kinase
MAERTRLIVGCMSGTSMDGIDAALVEVRGTGLEMSARFVRGASGPLGDGAAVLRRLAHGEACTAKEISQAARELALAHVAPIREACAGATPDFVCVHGQTVFHAPPLSWQLMNAAVVAREICVPVVHDLRAMDLASGGQGAPITPIADWVLFRGRGTTSGATCILNLGGFANATIWREGLGVDAIRGFDICACNQVLDALARERLGAPFDCDGEHGTRGRVDDAAFEQIRSSLAGQRAAGRSLGTGDEARAIVRSATARLSPEDACATAAGAIGEVIGNVLGGAIDHAAGGHEGSRRVLFAGGGARNAALCAAIANAVCVRDPRSSVATTADRGVPIEMREAVCFAVLGALCQDGVAITLPAVTHGAPGVISGSWTGRRGTEMF